MKPFYVLNFLSSLHFVEDYYYTNEKMLYFLLFFVFFLWDGKSWPSPFRLLKVSHLGKFLILISHFTLQYFFSSGMSTGSTNTPAVAGDNGASSSSTNSLADQQMREKLQQMAASAGSPSTLQQDDDQEEDDDDEFSGMFFDPRISLFLTSFSLLACHHFKYLSSFMFFFPR